MKKVLMFGIIAVGIVAAIGTTGFAYAQTAQPPTQAPGAGQGTYGYGRGFMGGMMAGFAQTGDADSYGPMHDPLISAFATSLGLTVDEVNTRLANGETLVQIAVAEGKTTAEAQTLVLDARNSALDQLVADGVLTSQQADWMKQHSAYMAQNGFGAGACGGLGAGFSGTGNGSAGFGRGAMMRSRLNVSN
ncbi:MAG: hypothetical protein M1281_09325 [Chloroflexi bacterium]|nr:hypothetical protein [Chloroflexota bacterium]